MFSAKRTKSREKLSLSLREGGTHTHIGPTTRFLVPSAWEVREKESPCHWLASLSLSNDNFFVIVNAKFLLAICLLLSAERNRSQETARFVRLEVGRSVVSSPIVPPRLWLPFFCTPVFVCCSVRGNRRSTTYEGVVGGPPCCGPKYIFFLEARRNRSRYKSND